ncbi:metal-dependent transcriptional regulator [Candidatus Bathyarchaeota archaeon]|nr:metal-dependent transcriptional regulator [Candidatus Bathyarchaeota archaeon]
MGADTTKTLSASEESYIETIDNLIREQGYARVTEIAAALNVKPPSVTNMLQKLDEQKYVTYKRYRGVILTKKGKSLAKTLERRHNTLKRFFIMIGVSNENAEKDACKIEHEIDPETAKKLAKFVESVQSAPRTPPFLEHFTQYLETGEQPKECKPKTQTRES